MTDAKKSVVLVVEDDEAILEFLKMTLEDDGFDVYTANNGKQGLAMIQEHHPKAVLLDLMLPEIDGFVILQKMSEDTTTSEIPVAVVSAYADATSTQDALKKAHNVKKVFLKPVRSEELLKQVRRMIDPA